MRCKNSPYFKNSEVEDDHDDAWDVEGSDGRPNDEVWIVESADKVVLATVVRRRRLPRRSRVQWLGRRIFCLLNVI